MCGLANSSVLVFYYALINKVFRGFASKDSEESISPLQ